jgi:hypothetical protein
MHAKDEVIGQRYLRNLITRFKFELSMAPALLLTWGGLLWLNRLYGVWSGCAFFWISAVVLLPMAYLFWESYHSAKLLARTRRLIIGAVRQEAAVELFRA